MYQDAPIAAANLAVPARTSVRTKEKRRKSLPASPYASTPRRRSANKVNIQPASTEVISSLISTLSAISSPAAHHFDNVPSINASQSTPVSPRAWQTEYRFPLVSQDGYIYKRDPSSPTCDGFGMDGNASRHTRAEVSLARPISEDLKTRSTAVCQEQLPQEQRNIGARSPLKPVNGEQDRGNPGNINIEPCRHLSSTSIPSITANTRPMNMRSYKDLKFSMSNDKIREGKERLWIHDDPQDNDQRSELRPRLRLSDSSLLSDNSASPSNLHSPIRIPKRSSSARHSIATMERDRSSDGTASPSSVGNGNYVPIRESSKRHSFSAGPAHSKRRSQRSEEIPQDPYRQPSFECRPEFPERELAQVMHDLIEEDDVTRRIKELKDQKKRRAQEQLLAAAESPALLVEDYRLSTQTRSERSEMSRVEDELRVQLPLHAAKTNESIAHPSAPSPAIAQRVERNSSFRLTFMGTQLSNIAATKDDGGSPKIQNSPPRRSNSRLLRRLSRPLSPDSEAKHRRTLSGGLSQPYHPFEERPKSNDLTDVAVQDFLAAPRLSQRVVDPQTGRAISFSEVGDPAGSAVFCCVGMGLTRYITTFYDELASTLRLRLITPDRPGVGGSEAHSDGTNTPLGWPDDVRAICQCLNLSKFSIIAHSAGAIYALATALRMPQHIRGRIHLLAPWIPPSQLSVIGSQQEALPASALPYSQRFLRSLPATFLKAANSSWLSATSASVTSKSPRRSKNRNRDSETLDGSKDSSRGDSPSPSTGLENDSDQIAASIGKDKENLTHELGSPRPPPPKHDPPHMAERNRQSTYDTRLTEAIWERATTGANPAVDLIVCLERRQPIGFRYVDIKKATVIHHGSKDTRVPLENVKWLGKTMRKCEVRVLEGEGHGLMASANVMGNILMEIAQEWDDWIRVTQGRSAL